MDFTTLNWFKNFTLLLLAKIIEILFRIILLMLPLGLFMLMIQSRSKASSVSNLSVYTTDNSVWQYVFPGFILVSIDQNSLKNFISTKIFNFQNWVNKYKYLLAVAFCISLLFLIIIGVKYGSFR